MKWTKTADALPPLKQDWDIAALYESEDVLIFDGWSMYVAFYRDYTDDPHDDESGWRIVTSDGDKEVFPTHWRKLPKAPALD
jgi:hypothetical protein